MPSPASSAAAEESYRPAASSTAAATRYGCGPAQASPRGMRRNSPAADGLPRGSMISLIARASMTMLAASCQSPACVACCTAAVSLPFRSYHRAARRCTAAIRSGYSRLSFSRSTSANNVW